MKERIVVYGRFDCKNEKGYTAMLVVIEYEEIMGRDNEEQLIKIGEQECVCFYVLRKTGFSERSLFQKLIGVG